MENKPVRKLFASAFVTLDGIMQAPGGPEEDPTGSFSLGDWMFHFADESMDLSASGFDGKNRELVLANHSPKPERFNKKTKSWKRKTMKTANPYLYFNGNTEEAFNFYKSVLNVEITEILRFGDIEGNPMGIPDDDLDKIAHITLPLGDTMLLGTDQTKSMGPPLTIGNNFYITLAPESAEEAENVFNGLADGGKILVPLKEEFWAEKFGMFIDKFGVQWMINYEGEAAS